MSAVSRRSFLQSAGLGALSALSASAQGPRASGPNVLMIAIDDLNDWIGVLGGNAQTLTPNIDALAKRGVAFRRAYCQAPSCNPSRASLMTGIRPSTSGVYNNNDIWRDAMPTAITVSEHFKLHGYETLGAGKIFHSNQNEERSWDYYFTTPGYLWPDETPANGLDMGHFDWGPLDVPDEETADYMITDWAAKYLGRKHPRSFFLAAGLYRPHLPWYAPEKYFEKFPEAAAILPKVLENDLDDVPPSVAKRSQRDHDNVTSSGQWKRAVSAYLACIHYADQNVGRILKALDEGPNAENTIIVLWTDHGWHLGEKKHWRKFTLWEESCRVPLIFAGKGVPDQGALCDRTVELLDVYPTLTDLAGLPARPECDGTSLRPWLDNPAAPRERPAMTHLGADKAAVRTERWRYIVHPDGEQLYDHDNDPMEWENLAAKPEHAQIRAELAAMLPKNPSRKQIAGWNELPEDQRPLAPLGPNRHHKPDPDKHMNLLPAPPE
ncbi:MAG: sulfatase-like hydrolase/transferase [Bryobacterales bacterium]|nr:sulfatase-like hydrolase/transferase [Bryobacterales bacterium]